jgi:hypothetical protein
VKSRRNFMPFGEDLYQGIGNRTSTLKYSINGDDIRQKFTGYQKDTETSLDLSVLGGQTGERESLSFRMVLFHVVLCLGGYADGNSGKAKAI